MKLLFFQWHSFMNKGIERGLKELDIPYDTFFINLMTGRKMTISWSSFVRI